MIYSVPGGFVISAGGVWRPGCFESMEAARVAAEIPDDAALQRLQDQANARAGGTGGVVTMEDLSQLSPKRPKNPD